MEVHFIKEQNIARTQKSPHAPFQSLATPKVKVPTIFISNSIY